MEQLHNSYILDFVIPDGPTGPTGPSNFLESQIYTNYNTSNTSGMLSIRNSLILPNNSNVFRESGNYIYIDEMGYYEFTISGYLAESTNSNNTSLILKTTMQNEAATNNLITIRLNNSKSESYFSYTKVGKYGSLQKVSLILNKTNGSDAHISEINLTIKKMPWTYS